MLVTWTAAVAPADVPMITSALVTSNPVSNRPAITPMTHALPADPPPPSTNARVGSGVTAVIYSASFTFPRTDRSACAAPIRPAASYGITTLAPSLVANLLSVSSCRIEISSGVGAFSLIAA